jgi:hypothetical protein
MDSSHNQMISSSSSASLSFLDPNWESESGRDASLWCVVSYTILASASFVTSALQVMQVSLRFSHPCQQDKHAVWLQSAINKSTHGFEQIGHETSFGAFDGILFTISLELFFTNGSDSMLLR